MINPPCVVKKELAFHCQNKNNFLFFFYMEKVSFKDSSEKSCKDAIQRKEDKGKMIE